MAADRIGPASTFQNSADPFYLGGTYKRLGELYEQKGDRAKAVENYQKFVDLWKDADPELQPKVQAVRDKLRKLTPVERPRPWMRIGCGLLSGTIWLPI